MARSNPIKYTLELWILILARELTSKPKQTNAPKCFLDSVVFSIFSVSIWFFYLRLGVYRFATWCVSCKCWWQERKQQNAASHEAINDSKKKDTNLGQILPKIFSKPTWRGALLCMWTVEPTEHLFLVLCPLSNTYQQDQTRVLQAVPHSNADRAKAMLGAYNKINATFVQQLCNQIKTKTSWVKYVQTHTTHIRSLAGWVRRVFLCEPVAVGWI